MYKLIILFFVSTHSIFSQDIKDFKIKTNPHNIIVNELNNNKIMMLGEAPHSDIFLYNSLINILNIWLEKAKNSRINNRLTLILERDKNNFTKSFIPVPFSPIQFDKSDNCNFLPKKSIDKNNYFKQFRSQWELGKKQKIVLVCTSRWQTETYIDDNCNRLSKWFSEYLTHLFNRLSKKVILIHIGEKCFNNCQSILNERYIWLPHLEPTYFDKLLNCIDLLLTANIASTIISKAIVLKKPIINLSNSRVGKSYNEIESQIEKQPDSKFEILLKRSLPIYPFYLWPIGFYKFLKPLISENDLLKAVIDLEILDLTTVIENVNQLLFNKNFKNKTIENITMYESNVNSLPNVEEVFSNYIN